MTYHPTTLTTGTPSEEIGEVLSALEDVREPLLFSLPNADYGASQISSAIDQFTRSHCNAVSLTDISQHQYYSLMSHAAVMVGNSSSGIWEAPTFALPVVNIGDRQNGRYHGANVISTTPDHTAIESALKQALSPSFRQSLDGMSNPWDPFGDGATGRRIAGILATAPDRMTLLQKNFIDLGSIA